MKIANYIAGEWVEGNGEGIPVYNPVTGEVIARAGSDGIDLGRALAYSRDQAGLALKALTYAQRAERLAATVEVLKANREKYVLLAQANSGNTPVDAAIDIDGGIGTLQYFAGLGQNLGANRYLREQGMARLARDKAFQAVHILTPLTGVAIHINAFNFPSWGLWEKAAVALLAGVPVFAKPATASCLVTHAMVRDVVDAQTLPAGCLSLLCGGGHTLLDHVTSRDAVVFTGSAETANRLRANPRVLSSNVRFNVEADSVNSALLAPDVTEKSPLFGAFIKEVAKEMTTKAGQKCTAIRRILVPQSLLPAVEKALLARLDKATVGLPGDDGVRVGPLLNKAQQKAALDGIRMLAEEAEILCGGKALVPDGADRNGSCYVAPTLLRCTNPMAASRVHDTEVFGPVATLMPFSNPGEAFELVRRGGGSLACSIFSGDSDFAGEATVALAPSHGRVLVVTEAVMESHTGHGIVMPQCVHGGPGRAGGGEELGGLRGLLFYHQRTAVQGEVALLEQLVTAAAEFTTA